MLLIGKKHDVFEVLWSLVITEIKTTRHRLEYIVGICSTLFLGHLFFLVSVQLTLSVGQCCLPPATPSSSVFDEFNSMMITTLHSWNITWHDTCNDGLLTDPLTFSLNRLLCYEVAIPCFHFLWSLNLSAVLFILGKRMLQSEERRYSQHNK